MALAYTGMPPTISSSLTAKKTLFLGLLNDGAPCIESYFNTNDRRARKKRARKHARTAKQEEPGGGKPIPGTLTDEVAILR